MYEELRKLASGKMAQESTDHTLQATALVHEAYIRLVDVDKAQHWDSRGHGEKRVSNVKLKAELATLLSSEHCEDDES